VCASSMVCSCWCICVLHPQLRRLLGRGDRADVERRHHVSAVRPHEPVLITERNVSERRVDRGVAVVDPRGELPVQAPHLAGDVAVELAPLGVLIAREAFVRLDRAVDAVVGRQRVLVNLQHMYSSTQHQHSTSTQHQHRGAMHARRTADQSVRKAKNDEMR
jgi:hypothetical protein